MAPKFHINTSNQASPLNSRLISNCLPGSISICPSQIYPKTNFLLSSPKPTPPIVFVAANNNSIFPVVQAKILKSSWTTLLHFTPNPLAHSPGLTFTICHSSFRYYHPSPASILLPLVYYNHLPTSYFDST